MGNRYINIEYIEEVCGKDKEIITEMIDIFREQVVDFGKEMNELYNNQDYFNLGLLAHKAKSSVAIMGMEDLAGKLKILELKAKEGTDVEMYSNIISDFKQQSSSAIVELDTYLKTI